MNSTLQIFLGHQMPEKGQKHVIKLERIFSQRRIRKDISHLPGGMEKLISHIDTADFQSHGNKCAEDISNPSKLVLTCLF